MGSFGIGLQLRPGGLILLAWVRIGKCILYMDGHVNYLVTNIVLWGSENWFDASHEPLCLFLIISNFHV